MKRKYMQQNIQDGFLSQMERRFNKKVLNYPRKDRTRKVNYLLKILAEVTLMLRSTPGFEFSTAGYAVLKWKLAQYLQSRDTISADDLYESLVMFSRFVDNNLERLEKALKLFAKQRKDAIAIERQRAIANEQSDPDIVATELENSFSLVRLTSWLHLIQESERLGHCIGNSDFYTRRMSAGEYVVYSLRDHIGLPVATLVYSASASILEQIRKDGDAKIDGDETWFTGLLEAIQAIGDIHGFSDQEPFLINEKELTNLSDEQKVVFLTRIDSGLHTTDRERGGGILSYQIKSIAVCATDFLDELYQRNYWIPSETREFWKQHLGLSKAAMRQTSKLVALSPYDLGLHETELFSYEQVCEQAIGLGYELCSVTEAGASILQYPVEQDYCLHFFGVELPSDDNQSCCLAIGNNTEQPVFFVHSQETQWFSTEQCLEYDYRFIFKNIQK
ncbi:MAG: hypothetical protein AAFQ87_02615 [Bacteroidota bacterium]